MNNRYRAITDRELRALTTQWLLAEEWQEVDSLLHDLEFVEAKIGRLGIVSLLQDYAAAIRAISFENGMREKLSATKRVLEIEAHNLDSYRQDTNFAFRAQQIYNQALANGVLSLANHALGRLSHINQPSLLLQWKAAGRGIPIERIIVAHTDGINGVAVTPNGKLAISASKDSTLKIWELDTLQERGTLRGHKGAVNAVQITSDGSRAVSASDDKTLKIWNLKSGLEECTLSGHKDRVLSVQITPNDAEAVSMSADHTLKVWDLQRGEIIRTSARRFSGLVYRLNQLMLWPLILLSCIFFVLSSETLGTGYLNKIIDSFGNQVCSFGKDMPFCLSLVEILFVLLFCVVLGGLFILAYFLSENSSPLDFRAIALINKNRLASGDDGGAIRIWNLDTAKEETVLGASKSGIVSLAILPDGRIISGSGQIADLKDKEADRKFELTPLVDVWNAETELREHSLDGHKDGIYGIAVSNDGHLVASGSNDCTVRIWSSETWENLDVLYGHSQCVNAVVFTPHQNRIISASDDGTIRIWNPQLLKVIGNQHGSGHKVAICSIAISESGYKGISASIDGMLKVWKMETGDEEWCDTMEDVTSVSVASSGDICVFGQNDTTLLVYDMLAKEFKHTLLEKTNSSYSLTTFDVSRDGTRAISINLEDFPWAVAQAGLPGPLETHERVDLWDLDAGMLVYTTSMKEKRLNRVAFSPDGQRALLASRDGVIRFWLFGKFGDFLRREGNLDNLPYVKAPNMHLEYSLGTHDGLTTLALSPDGRHAISGAKDGTVKIWNMSNGREVYSSRRHRDKVGAIAITLNGRHVISGAEDGSIKVWNLITGETEAVAQLNVPITTIAVGEGGITILVGDSAGNVHCFQLEFFRGLSQEISSHTTM